MLQERAIRQLAAYAEKRGIRKEMHRQAAMLHKRHQLNRIVTVARHIISEKE